jgi:hypothetical protein
VWFTDSQLQAIPAFTGLSADQITQAAVDAGTLYAQVALQPGIADTDLRAWGESAGVTPDRYNLAVAVLAQAGRALNLMDGSITPAVASPVVPVADPTPVDPDAEPEPLKPS